MRRFIIFAIVVKLVKIMVFDLSREDAQRIIGDALREVDTNYRGKDLFRNRYGRLEVYTPTHASGNVIRSYSLEKCRRIVAAGKVLNITPRTDIEDASLTEEELIRYLAECIVADKSEKDLQKKAIEISPEEFREI